MARRYQPPRATPPISRAPFKRMVPSIHARSLISALLAVLCCCPVGAFAFHQNNNLARPRPIVLRATPDTSSASSAAAATSDAAQSDSPNRISIALTREEGKNGKLSKALAAHEGIKMMGLELDLTEMPCIEHAAGKERGALIDILSSDEIKDFDYVVITSPEAARVLSAAIEESDTDLDTFNDTVQVAAVGKATGKVLSKLGIDVDFVPSQANGETLAAELPSVGEEGSATRVLYPASAKARNDIKEGLEARTETDGTTFEFTRLDTYDTVPSSFTEEQLAIVDDIEIACFGSPSAVKAWLKNIDVKGGYEDMDEEEKKKLGPDGNGNVLAACIGTTSARACLESGRWNAMDIYYPKENPGVESWAATIAQATGDVFERKFWA